MTASIDMLVENAGIGMRTVNPHFMTQAQGFWEVPVSGFRDVVETNLTGYFLVAPATRRPCTSLKPQTAPRARTEMTGVLDQIIQGVTA